MNAVIVVRTGSTRLPKKCLLPFGEGNVLEHIVRRALDFNYDQIVIATTWLPEDDIIEIFVNDVFKGLVKCYRGQIDVDSRLDNMEKELKLGSYERIDGDDLFFIPKPKDGIHRYVGDWHDSAEGYKNCVNQIRLTLDYWEDYRMLNKVLIYLGTVKRREETDADEIIELFTRHPYFYKDNWFRQKDYKENQQCELKESDIPV